MKLLILKLIIFLLAFIGIHLPSPYVYVCIPGHAPTTPSNCEVVKL